MNTSIDCMIYGVTAGTLDNNTLSRRKVYLDAKHNVYEADGRPPYALEP